MDRIAQAFARAAAENRAAFVAYICAGDPNIETSLAAARVLIEAGTDILELGVPFSDPLADGLTNQLAAQRALASGVTGEQVLDLVRRLREEFPATPIIFYTYYNLVFAQGVEDYVARAAAAGLDGMLTLDLPPEEASDISAALARQDMRSVFIVAPTTPAKRLARIAAAATGFIYYVSREGVTGVRDEVASGIASAVDAIKTHTSLPVVVGFGIGTRAHVHQVAQLADGVVVGSALVNVIKEHANDVPALLTTLRAKTQDLVAGLPRQ